MKKTINKEVTICDKCKREAYVNPCLGCGTEMCFDCRNQNGHSYNQGVFTQGSHDGFYCNACDARLRTSRTDKRHTAYLAIRSLRLELDAWNEDFDKRKDAAEDTLKSLRV